MAWIDWETDHTNTAFRKKQASTMSTLSNLPNVCSMNKCVCLHNKASFVSWLALRIASWISSSQSTAEGSCVSWIDNEKNAERAKELTRDVTKKPRFGSKNAFWFHRCECTEWNRSTFKYFEIFIESSFIGAIYLWNKCHVYIFHFKKKHPWIVLNLYFWNSTSLIASFFILCFTVCLRNEQLYFFHSAF